MKVHTGEERIKFIKKCPRKRSASGVILKNKLGEWLLLKTSYHAGKYTFPGGITNQYESPWEGVIREVKEEINITINKNNLQILSITNISNEKINDELVIYYFDGGILTDNQIKNIRPDGKEILDYKFVPQEKVLDFLRENAHYSYHHISTALNKKQLIMVDVKR